jgi:hypothetical protein
MVFFLLGLVDGGCLLLLLDVLNYDVQYSVIYLTTHIRVYATAYLYPDILD